MAVDRDVEVFTAFCESHTSQVPFHAVARLLRAATGVEGLEARRPATECATGFLTRTRRTCCCLMTCWVSPILKLLCRQSIRMPVGGG